MLPFPPPTVGHPTVPLAEPTTAHEHHAKEFFPLVPAEIDGGRDVNEKERAKAAATRNNTAAEETSGAAAERSSSYAQKGSLLVLLPFRRARRRRC